MSLNKVELIGRIGNIATHAGENKRVEASIAVDAGYRDDKSGDWVDRTDWIQVQSWNPNIVERIGEKYRKGDLVYCEAALKPWSKGEGDDKRYGMNINVNVFRLLARPNNNASDNGA